MGNQTSLLRPRRMRVGPSAGSQNSAAAAAAPFRSKSSSNLLLPTAEFRPVPASAGVLLGVTAGQRLRYTSLAALLKATPVTALLTAQRQKVVSIRTSEKSLKAAFQKLIAAEVLSAPVYNDTEQCYIGFLDLRDLLDLTLLRYLWRREAAAAVAAAASAGAKPVVSGVSSHATTSSKASTAMTDDASAAKKEKEQNEVKQSIVALDFLEDALSLGETASLPASAPGVGAAAAGTPPPVKITLESLAERYPWRPVPSTASLFDVAKELLTDVRRVPVVDVESEQLLGVVTQSAIISFLASKMSEVSGRGHPIKAPLVFNPTANAVAQHDAGAKPTLDAKQSGATAAAAAVPPALAKAKSIPEGMATGASGLAQAAAVSGEAAAAIAAKNALNGLELLETGSSEWQKPMHELSLPGASASGEGPAPAVTLGTCPVWSIPSDVSVVEALWAMSESATSSAAVSGPDGGLVATLSASDLKLFLRSNRSKFGDALLDMNVLDFIAAVRQAESAAAVAAVRSAHSLAEREAAIGHEKSHTPVMCVGPNASLAQVVHRLAVCHAHKIYVVGPTAPFVPLRVITLTDILRYVVAADEAEAASTAAAVAAATAAAATNAAAPTTTTEAPVVVAASAVAPALVAAK